MSTESIGTDPQPDVAVDVTWQLRAELATRARAIDVLDVTYRTVDSPIGDLLIAATPRGLVRVAFAQEGFDAVVESLAALVSPRILRASERLEEAARQLDDYFAGRRLRFDLALDRQLSHGFRMRVHEYLSQIPFGSTLSYKQVAQDVGSPNAVRAVGTACAKNPLPVVVPCHRVLRSDGTSGGYVGGIDAKKTLLTLEGAA